MLARVLRLPGRLLGALAIAVLLVQVVRVVPEMHWFVGDDEFASVGFFLNLFLPAFFVATGRVLLAFLPPGEVGEHGAHGLPITLATSLLFGCLVALPLGALVPNFLPVYALVVVLALVRWTTLPGAMVPRHSVGSEPLGLFDAGIALVAVAWAALLALAENGVQALVWFALAVLLFHGLGVARRCRSGRYACLCLVALSYARLDVLVQFDDLQPAVSLGMGATFLVGWLRRADRRAGALAGIGFGSLFLGGCEALALVGALVFVLASHARQRRFALGWVGTVGALSLLLAWLHGRILPAPRGRLWLAGELGFQLESWGLTWPAVLGALALGALSFRWQAGEWQPGVIEEPRREVLALLALVLLAGLALALPISPWAEAQMLAILFSPCVLLAGLLLIPPERVTETA